MSEGRYVNLLRGTIGQNGVPPDSPLHSVVSKWREHVRSDGEFPCLRDKDFVNAFVTAVPDTNEQISYVENTSQYLRGESGFDANKVLLFRRSLPSTEPKPEKFWTSDFVIATNGLRYEIPDKHRLFTVILCSSLADVLSDGGLSESYSGAASDGEIKVDTSSYDQKRCICVYRPGGQQQKLDQYLQSENHLTLDQILDMVKH